MYTCFFIGHRDAPSSIQEKLNETVERLVKECWVTDFVVGRYGNFDRMAVSAVQRVICMYPRKEVTAELLDPYIYDTQSRPFLPNHFDSYYYPEGLEAVPKRYCIEKANQLVLDESDYLICYVTRDGGNAAKLFRRAKRLEKKKYIKVLNLADMECVPYNNIG